MPLIAPSGMRLIERINTTSGNTANFANIPNSPMLMCIIESISNSFGSANLQMALSSGGSGALTSFVTIGDGITGAAEVANGFVSINQNTLGRGGFVSAAKTVTAAPHAITATSCSGVFNLGAAINYIRIIWAGDRNFDAGSISLWAM